MRLATIRVTHATQATPATRAVLAGVGQARKPPRFLVGGETVTAAIEGIGQTVNRVVKEVAQ